MSALLVSVRNAVEARCAIDGGCEILDVKEPTRGSLGRADAAEIAAVLGVRDACASSIPVSVALGEVLEAETDEEHDLANIASEIHFLKLGTAGLGRSGDWKSRFLRARRKWGIRLGSPASESNPQWVAVAYADWKVAESPPPAEIISGATDCGCSGLLIDTFAKSAGGLFHSLAVDELQRLAAAAREHGLWFALAGRLALDDLRNIQSIAPDIVGIRSAACRGRRRNDEIDPAAVRAFRGRMLEVCPT